MWINLRAALFFLAALGLAVLPASAGDPPQVVPDQSSGAPVSVRLYPVLVQAPIYGATVDVPSIPGGGGGSEGESATTQSSINSAYLGGIELYVHRAFGEVDLLWAKPSASSDATPRIGVDTTLWAWTFKGGFRLFKGFGVTGGARRLSLDLNTTLQFPQSGVTLQGQNSRVTWNPFLGADWRGELNRKWLVDMSADFGVATGNDASTRLRARVDWQPIPHFAIRLGYQYLRLKVSTDTFVLGGVPRSLSTTQNMHGPELGFGFVF